MARFAIKFAWQIGVSSVRRHRVSRRHGVWPSILATRYRFDDKVNAVPGHPHDGFNGIERKKIQAYIIYK